MFSQDTVQINTASDECNICFRWKDECQMITQKFENKIAELRGELSRYKKQNDELTKLLKQSRDKNIEVCYFILQSMNG